MAKHTFITTQNDQGRKLIKFLASIFKKTPLSKIHKILRVGDVKINSQRIKNPNFIVQADQTIEIFGLNNNDATLFTHKKNNQNLSIVYEDDNILIINKQINTLVHGHPKSLDNQVLNYLRFNQTSSFKPSHVGRLDKITSGIIVYAKNYSTLAQLNSKHSNFTKIYKFIPTKPIKTGEYNFWIEKDEMNQKMKVVNHSTKNACIAKTLIYSVNNQYFAEILTGRKHQIRLSCAYLDAPILGDVKYGAKPDKRVYLHSYSITFNALEGNIEYLNQKTFKIEPDNWV